MVSIQNKSNYRFKIEKIKNHVKNLVENNIKKYSSETFKKLSNKFNKNKQD